MSSRNPSGFPPCGKSTVQGGESHHRSARENFQYTHSYRCGSSSRPHLWRDLNPEARGVFVTPLLVLTLHRVRQGALQECTDLLEGSRERSNSHELSTTRLSVGGGKRSGVHSATRNLPLSSRGALHTTRQWPSTAHCTERARVANTNRSRLKQQQRAAQHTRRSWSCDVDNTRGTHRWLVGFGSVEGSEVEIARGVAHSPAAVRRCGDFDSCARPVVCAPAAGRSEAEERAGDFAILVGGRVERYWGVVRVL
jgi:hypothetical protein